MTWKSTGGMTRDELEDEVRKLRAALERIAVDTPPAGTSGADLNRNGPSDRDK